MLLRSAALLALTVLAAGCDSADPAPDMFEATFRGDPDTTIVGAYAYTLLSRYTGLGTGDGFSVQLRTQPSSNGSFVWDEASETTRADAAITLSFGDAEVPEGTYQIEGRPWAGAIFYLNGQFHSVGAGTVIVDQQRGRLVGTFRFTDVFGAHGHSNLQAEGRFDVETGL